MSFSLKYRPKRFSEVIGQEHVVRTLKNALRKKRVSFAYLFCGPRGTGKTSIARLLAKALNCLNVKDGEPCAECRNCKDPSLDVIEIDGASHRGIEEVRALQEIISLCPISGSHKVFIIDEVHMLTEPAFNALLKTLEEPPKHTIFVFCTTAPWKVPQTVLSRTQRFDFKKIPPQLIMENIKMIAKEEGLKITEGAARFIALAAEGSLRDAQMLLEQAICYNEEVTEEGLCALLGRVSEEKVLQLLQFLSEGDAKCVIEWIDEFVQEGIELGWLLKDVSNMFKNVLFLKISPALVRELELEPHVAERLNLLSSLWKEEELLYALDILMECQERMRRTQDPYMLFLVKILQCCAIKEKKFKEREEFLDSFIEEIKREKPYLATSLSMAEKKIDGKKITLLFDERHAQTYAKKVMEEKEELEKILSRDIEVVLQKIEEKDPLIEEAIKIFDAKVLSG